MWPLYRYRQEQGLRAMGDEAVERCSTWNSRDVAVVGTPHMERWPLLEYPPPPSTGLGQDRQAARSEVSAH
jgi:hypothetical protein